MTQTTGAAELPEALRNLLWAALERDKGNRIRQFDEFVDNARATLSQVEALIAAQAGVLPDEVLQALKPFAEIGAWLFARDLPDHTPLVEIVAINGAHWKITRGQFKAAALIVRQHDQAVDVSNALIAAPAQTAPPPSPSPAPADCGNTPYDEGPFTLSAPAQPGQEGEVVLWVSPEQFANFKDNDEAPFGTYLPARKTSAGKFTMPLFAARAAPQPAVVSNELGNFIACFDAAFAEGLTEVLAETTDTRLKDLVERRLLIAYAEAIGPTTQQPATADAVRTSCFDAADMATASSDGFRAGQNSVKQGGA